MLFRHSRNIEENWMTRLADKAVLVVAEFRPHILDRMLRSGIKVTQIHPPTPDGDVPPHFYHLCRHGFIGVLDFKALAEIAVDMLLFEAAHRFAEVVYQGRVALQGRQVGRQVVRAQQWAFTAGLRYYKYTEDKTLLFGGAFADETFIPGSNPPVPGAIPASTDSRN